MESVLLDAPGTPLARDHARLPPRPSTPQQGRAVPRAWEQLDPWLEIRRGLPIGAVPCVIHGPTAGPGGRRRPRAGSCTVPPWQPGCDGRSRPVALVDAGAPRDG
jgi:hypothetical protein